jgi:predicted SAM-dependent methyltransferase
MRLLNLACGAVRPASPWVNLDELRKHLAPGTPERTNLDAEPNYVEFDALSGPLPFGRDTFNGVLASHCVEHWDALEAVRVLKECHRVLMPEGALIVSVPDATYFRNVHGTDTIENAEKLFGETIQDEGKDSFLEYALLYRYHKQVLTEDALWALMRGAGFADRMIKRYSESVYQKDRDMFRSDFTETIDPMIALLNRQKFSLVMIAFKS